MLDSIITKMLREKPDNYIELLNRASEYNRYLNDLEKQAIQYINDHADKYKALVSEETFLKEFPYFKSEALLSDTFDYGFDEFVKDLKERHLNKIAHVVDAMIINSDYEGVQELNKMVKEIPEPTHDIPVTSVLDDFDNYSEKIFAGLDTQTGFQLGLGKYIDQEVGYIVPSRIVAIISHQKSGKTTLLSNVAVKAYIEGKKVLICTYEITREGMYEKLFAVIGGYNTKLYSSFRGTPEQLELQKNKVSVRDKIEMISAVTGGKLSVRSKLTLGEIRKLQIKERKETGRQFDLVLIDNIYLMKPDIPVEGFNSWVAREWVVENLRALVVGDTDDDTISEDQKVYPFSAIISSQFNPNTDGSSSSDIGKTKTIAEICDCVLSMTKDDSAMPYGRFISILENRHGGSFGVMGKFKFDFDTTSVLVENGSAPMKALAEIPTSIYLSRIPEQFVEMEVGVYNE